MNFLFRPKHEIIALETISSDANYIVMRLEVFRTNHYIYEQNYLQFNNYLYDLQDRTQSGDIWQIGKEDLLAQNLKEVIRLLHNYVAGAKTLVDHTRNLINKYYSDSPFLKEYKAEVEKRFVTNPLAGFVEDLRNYTLYYQQPFPLLKF